MKTRIIDASPFTADEVNVIITKLDSLFINYSENKDKIFILDKIDDAVFNYIMDFSKI
jgi:hypothetical protein